GPGRARRRSTICWAAGVVLQRDSPLAVAIFPSKVAATFNVTNGRPAVISLRYGVMSCSASPVPTPTSTRSPARRNAASPRPLTWGFGSRMAATTRWTPLAMMRGAHGGVRFSRWQQGSSVTYSVAPRVRGPACRRATTSAWGPPARRWYPAPTTAPWRTTTAPTGGFGLVWPAPRHASATACAMNRSAASRWLSGNGTLVTSPPVGHRPCPSGWTPRGMATSFRFIGSPDGGLCRGKPRDRHPVRRATDIVEAEGVTEGDGRGIATVLAADAQLDIRTPLPAPLDRQLHEPPDALLVERRKGIGIEDVLRRRADPQAA